MAPKEPERTFCEDENVFYLDYAAGYTNAYIFQNA